MEIHLYFDRIKKRSVGCMEKLRIKKFIIGTLIIFIISFTCSSLVYFFTLNKYVVKRVTSFQDLHFYKVEGTIDEISSEKEEYAFFPMDEKDGGYIKFVTRSDNDFVIYLSGEEIKKGMIKEGDLYQSMIKLNHYASSEIVNFINSKTLYEHQRDNFLKMLMKLYLPTMFKSFPLFIIFFYSIEYWQTRRKKRVNA